jgi:ABC-type uncharacterized transport system substrate-binding protein
VNVANPIGQLGSSGSDFAKEATATIPIVMVAVSDPLGSGLVPSLARPGGNVTSTSTSRRRPKFTLR